MSELINAIKQVCEEKKINYDLVVSAIESALAAAYRKDYGNKLQNIKVVFNPETSQSKISDVKTVVEDLTEKEEEALLQKIEELKKQKINRKEREPRADLMENKEEETLIGEEERKFNPKTEIQLKDALLIKKDAKIGDEIVFDLEEPEGYGRMAAQTAKQVIVQKIREIEKETIFNEFKDQEGGVVNGLIQRVEGRLVFVDLDKAIGILPMDEQIYGERYNVGGRIKVYIKEVRSGVRGAEIVLSRKSEEIVRQIFMMEIPELANGLIEIKSIAREAGSRSKVAIYTDSENIDPVGSCVGQRGVRIQTIINELGGEKIDIVEYNEDPNKYIANALAPAKILSIKTDEKLKRAIVKVDPEKLSLAIGKAGQNARLAARLTGWKIDILPYNSEEEIDNGSEEIVKEIEEDQENNLPAEENVEEKTEVKAEKKIEKKTKTKAKTKEVEPKKEAKTEKKPVKKEAKKESKKKIEKK
ncbi:MAG: transcription termination factor NusA [Patescibacteria group bacterium]|nr:transcription termination factor NusA [Patescibacteria group bacterium]